MNSFSLRFDLFGVKVTIQPICWLLLAFLGGAFEIGDGTSLESVLFFMIAGVICLLAHELGHALVGRFFCGGRPEIELNGLGGVATNPTMRPPSRWQFFALVAAGPLAGLLPAVMAVGALALWSGSLSAAGAAALFVSFPYTLTFVDAAAPVFEVIVRSEQSFMMYDFIINFVIIGFWWTVINLLPIFPLDGSKLLGTLIANYLVTACIGAVLCLACIAFFIAAGAWWNVVIFIYLFIMNWSHLRSFWRMRQ